MLSLILWLLFAAQGGKTITVPPNSCKLVDSSVMDMKEGECAYLWIVFRDSDGTYLAFKAETVRSKPDNLFHDHRIEMRKDGMHVWLFPGESIAKAEKKLWDPIFLPLRVHQ